MNENITAFIFQFGLAVLFRGICIQMINNAKSNKMYSGYTPASVKKNVFTVTFLLAGLSMTLIGLNVESIENFDSNNQAMVCDGLSLSSNN